MYPHLWTHPYQWYQMLRCAAPTTSLENCRFRLQIEKKMKHQVEWTEPFQVSETRRKGWTALPSPGQWRAHDAMTQSTDRCWVAPPLTYSPGCRSGSHQLRHQLHHGDPWWSIDNCICMEAYEHVWSVRCFIETKRLNDGWTVGWCMVFTWYSVHNMIRVYTCIYTFNLWT